MNILDGFLRFDGLLEFVGGDLLIIFMELSCFNLFLVFIFIFLLKVIFLFEVFLWLEFVLVKRESLDLELKDV